LIKATLHNCHLPDKEQREMRMSNYLTRKFNQCEGDIFTAMDDFNRRRDIVNKTMRVGKRGSYRKANRLWYMTLEITNG